MMCFPIPICVYILAVTSLDFLIRDCSRLCSVQCAELMALKQNVSILETMGWFLCLHRTSGMRPPHFTSPCFWGTLNSPGPDFQWGSWSKRQEEKIHCVCRTIALEHRIPPRGCCGSPQPFFYQWIQSMIQWLINQSHTFETSMQKELKSLQATQMTTDTDWSFSFSFSLGSISTISNSESTKEIPNCTSV